MAKVVGQSFLSVKEDDGLFIDNLIIEEKNFENLNNIKKVFEALMEQEVLTEDSSPKTPTEAPIPSKELEELNESEKLKETLSDNKKNTPKIEISKE